MVTDGDEVVDITTATSIDIDCDDDRTAHDYGVQAVNEFGGLSAKTSPGLSGISEINAPGTLEIVAIYDIHGRRLTDTVSGVNIVCYADAAGNTCVKKLVMR